jgi:hypothetical protein
LCDFTILTQFMKDNINIYKVYFIMLITDIFYRYYCVYDNAVQGVVDSVKFDCPRGYYCPQGTGHDWQPCPAGTFGTQKNYYQVSKCNFLLGN